MGGPAAEGGLVAQVIIMGMAEHARAPGWQGPSAWVWNPVRRVHRHPLVGSLAEEHPAGDAVLLLAGVGWVCSA